MRAGRQENAANKPSQTDIRHCFIARNRFIPASRAWFFSKDSSAYCDYLLSQIWFYRSKCVVSVKRLPNGFSEGGTAIRHRSAISRPARQLTRGRRGRSADGFVDLGFRGRGAELKAKRGFHQVVAQVHCGSVGDSSVEPLEQAEPTGQATPAGPTPSATSRRRGRERRRCSSAEAAPPMLHERRCSAEPRRPCLKRLRKAVNRRAYSSCSLRQSSKAVAMPMANATGSVPGRSPSC